MERRVRKIFLGATVTAGLLVPVLAGGAAWAQGAPRTCTEAYTACTTANKALLKECGDEKQWCIKTGTFADPKSKATTSNLQKK